MKESAVRVFKRVWIPPTDQRAGHYEERDDGTALFCAWGVSWEELTQGVGTYSTAIIRRHDGTVENVPVEQIQFIWVKPSED